MVWIKSLGLSKFMLSSAEENYVKAIYHLLEDGEKVGTNQLAERMQTKAASVSDMLRKLEAKGMLNYEKYYGCSLTEAGRLAALGIIRRHRLWEFFLAEKLGYSWDEVHGIAEQLEHVRADDLTSRLDAFLGYPKLDPHGDPIPDEAGTISASSGLPLTNLAVGSAGTIVRVADLDDSLLAALGRLGLVIGQQVRMEALGGEHTLWILTVGTNQVALEAELAAALFVKGI